MSNAVVINLREKGYVDVQTFLTGPLRRVRLVELQSGETEALVADTQEYTLFTMSGSGNAVSTSVTVPLQQGVAVTLPLGGNVTIEAGTEGLEFFLASLAVPSALESAK